MLTPSDVEEVRVRAEEATSGPWEEGTRTPLYGDGTPGPIVCHPVGAPICYFGRQGAKHKDLADSKFIAHARTDVPALCETVVELRKMLDEAVEVVEWTVGKSMWGDPAEIKEWGSRTEALLARIREERG